MPLCVVLVSRFLPLSLCRALSLSLSLSLSSRPCRSWLQRGPRRIALLLPVLTAACASLTCMCGLTPTCGCFALPLTHCMHQPHDQTHPTALHHLTGRWRRRPARWRPTVCTRPSRPSSPTLGFSSPASSIACPPHATHITRIMAVDYAPLHPWTAPLPCEPDLQASLQMRMLLQFPNGPDVPPVLSPDSISHKACPACCP